MRPLPGFFVRTTRCGGLCPRKKPRGGSRPWVFAARRTPCTPVSAPAGLRVCRSGWPRFCVVRFVRRVGSRLGLGPLAFWREVRCVLRRWVRWRPVVAAGSVGGSRSVRCVRRSCRRPCARRLCFGGRLGRGSRCGRRGARSSPRLLRLAVLLLRPWRWSGPLGAGPRRPRRLVCGRAGALRCGRSRSSFARPLALGSVRVRRGARSPLAGHVARRPRGSRRWRAGVGGLPAPSVGGCFRPSSAWPITRRYVVKRCPYCHSHIIFMFTSALGSNICACSKCPYIGAYTPDRVITIAKGVRRGLAHSRP
jgi:hypothetical protein